MGARHLARAYARADKTRATFLISYYNIKDHNKEIKMKLITLVAVWLTVKITKEKLRESGHIPE